ncbi:MAG: SoxR reducing system RseC family protein [Deltaproteobacteria bacterium]|nr:SoxR reducing system RseC family protein [Deltaproteobacteria bacterium]
MEEHGVIVKDKGLTALIKAERTTACEKCVQKDSCLSTSDVDMLIEADNPIGAKPGDHVVFTIGAGSIVKAGMLLYLVPIVSFIAGVVLGQTLAKRAFTDWNPDLVSGVLGLIFLAATFIGLKVYGKVLVEKNKAYRPSVLRKI